MCFLSALRLVVWCGCSALILYHIVETMSIPLSQKRGKLQHVRELVSLFSCLIRSPYQVLGYETNRAQVFSGCPGKSPSHTLNNKATVPAKTKSTAPAPELRSGGITISSPMIYSTVPLTAGPGERGENGSSADGRCAGSLPHSLPL